ncbi:MAG: hypothetical protein WD802_01925 [Gemmatimonadaceae bacterium]
MTPMGAPELVLSEMKLGGAERVADRIDSDLRFAQTVMDGIATGDSLWLEVAAVLPLNSASAEANFIIALAAALPRNPETVLSLLPLKAQVRDVCGIPFLKANPEMVLSYYDGAVAAIARVRTPSLAATAQSCAVALASAREHKLERIDSSYLVKNKPVAPKPARSRRTR